MGYADYWRVGGQEGMCLRGKKGMKSLICHCSLLQQCWLRWQQPHCRTPCNHPSDMVLCMGLNRGEREHIATCHLPLDIPLGMALPRPAPVAGKGQHRATCTLAKIPLVRGDSGDPSIGSSQGRCPAYLTRFMILPLGDYRSEIIRLPYSKLNSS